MYQVIHKGTGRETSLHPLDINDMFIDDHGRIMICSTEMELYWLLADIKELFE